MYVDNKIAILVLIFILMLLYSLCKQKKQHIERFVEGDDLVINNLTVDDIKIGGVNGITIKKNGDDLDLGSSVKASTYRMGCDRGKYLGCWGGVFYLKNNKNGLNII
jgi:hypothetical protein